MEETAVTHYSWLDIIEPVHLDADGYTWEYLLILVVVLLLFLFLNRYLKLNLRFKLWLLSYKLAKDANPRLCAKKLLDLLPAISGSKQASQVVNISQQNAINECRLMLTEACYAKDTLNAKKMLNVLSMLKKHL